MSQILIEQVPTTYGDPGESVTLDGSYLPDRGVVTPVEQRFVRHRAPGSSVPTIQVLGATREPVTLRGRFHDGTSGDFGGALDKVRTLERFVESGIIVRVVWTVDGDSLWDLTAILSRFAASWEDRHVMGWELTFEPIEAGDAMREKVRVRLGQQRTARDAEQELQRAKATAVAAMTAQAAAAHTKAAARLAIARAS